MRALIRVHYFNDQHVHRIGIRDAHASYIYIYIYMDGSAEIDIMNTMNMFTPSTYRVFSS